MKTFNTKRFFKWQKILYLLFLSISVRVIAKLFYFLCLLLLGWNLWNSNIQYFYIPTSNDFWPTKTAISCFNLMFLLTFLLLTKDVVSALCDFSSFIFSLICPIFCCQLSISSCPCSQITHWKPLWFPWDESLSLASIFYCYSTSYDVFLIYQVICLFLSLAPAGR